VYLTDVRLVLPRRRGRSALGIRSPECTPRLPRGHSLTLYPSRLRRRSHCGQKPGGAYNSTTSVPVSTRFFRFGSGFPSQNASAAELSQRPSSALPCEIALANVRTAASTCAFVSDPDANASAMPPCWCRFPAGPRVLSRRSGSRREALFALPGSCTLSRSVDCSQSRSGRSFSESCSCGRTSACFVPSDGIDDTHRLVRTHRMESDTIDPASLNAGSARDRDDASSGTPVVG
jgi:hypothetical protein